jgi:Raf kinase inhibitor-like YbhB/YbcL family protein
MFARRRGLAAAVVVATAAPTLAFEISSSSVSDGKWDQKYLADKVAGCDGGNVSPALAWKDVPEGTKSLAVTLYDPDAPTGSGWWHWQAWNTPTTIAGFDEGKVPEGVVEGKGDIGRQGYLGPCIGPGSGVHHYTFTIYALKVDKLDLDPNTASSAFVGYNLNGNALAKASVTYTFEFAARPAQLHRSDTPAALARRPSMH